VIAGVYFTLRWRHNLLAYDKKQRVVGTLVLILLMSILFPVVFDGSEDFKAQLESRIPLEPIIAILPEPSQVRPAIVADSVAVSLNDEIIDEVVESGDNDSEIMDMNEKLTPQLNEIGLPEGWSIRLGSFAQQENATSLIERLRAAEYKAYTRNISNSAGELTSVLVGPWIDRTSAEKYLIELEDQFRLAGDIVNYEIDNF